jgi:putative FmdB family regulatory protein
VPTYQYACTNCDHRFEAVQAFSDASLTVCPECAGKLRKVFSSVGIVFKGSGFYRTDSRAAAGSTVAKGESSSEGSSSSTSDSGSGSSSSAEKKSESTTKSEKKSDSKSSTPSKSSPAAAAS